MSFKENLIEKIEIDRLAEKVLQSFSPSAGERRIDKEAMRELLGKSPFEPRKNRDLELFVDLDDPKRILVLDNELPIYETTIEDVALRKSPTVKEMVNLRNVIKILNDRDVKVTTKEESLRAVQKESIARLDLTFDESDIDDIRIQGAASLESGYREGISEALALFAELLGYSPPPKALSFRHRTIYGKYTDSPSGNWRYGPVIIHDLTENSLSAVDREIENTDRQTLEYLQSVIEGKEKAPIQGPKVFDFLADSVKRRRL